MNQTPSALDKNLFIISLNVVFVLQKNLSEPLQSLQI